MIIVNSDSTFGLSCIKSVILFVNKEEIFCSQKIKRFFPSLTHIQYDRDGKNLLHSMKDIRLLNMSLPSLDITEFQRLHFNNVSDKLQTLKEYIRHSFHPIKRFQKNPIEALYTFLATLMTLVGAVFVGIIIYFCCVKICVPTLTTPNIGRYFSMPARFSAGRNVQEPPTNNVELQPANIRTAVRAIQNPVGDTTENTNQTIGLNAVERGRVFEPDDSNDSNQPPAYSSVRNTTVAFNNRDRQITTMVNQPTPAPRTRRHGANDALSLLGYSIRADQMNRL